MKQYFPAVPKHFNAPVAHRYPTIQRLQQAPNPRMPETPEQNPPTPPRVAPRLVHIFTQKETNHMVPIILIETHNTAKQIEDEKLPW